MTTSYSPAEDAARPRYVLAVHGGAGVEPDRLGPAEKKQMEASLTKALTVGRDILERGGSSLDAVEASLRLLEDDPQFNAGKGSVFNSAGECELDASIMDGRTKACGAVAGVKTVKNPISLARLVMTRTRHVLLIGSGADDFAREMGVEQVGQEYFRTEYRRQDWLRVKKRQEDQERKRNQPPGESGASTGEGKAYKGTVGCVALDSHGNLAAGTSTGGLTNKRFGRVGDSPIVGAGCYADNDSCAVSCTGTGEEFIRHAAAFHVAALIRYKGMSVEEAASEVIFRRLSPDDGGMIVLGADGQVAMPFSTAGMARGVADSSGRLEVRLGK